MTQITPEIITGLAKSNTDFGFEMRVGRSLRSLEQLRVRHAETYVDPRTGVERHFDYQCAIRNEGRLLQLAIECKNLFPDSPVVVCGHKRILSESFHDIVFSGNGMLQGKDGTRTLANGLVSEVCGVGPESDLYPSINPVRNFVGKSVFRPKPPAKNVHEKSKLKPPFSGYTITRDNDDYDCWNQAVGSAGAMALRSLEFEVASGKPTYVFTVTLPIVVVPDSALWQIEFDENGEIVGSATAAEHVSLFRDHRITRTADIGTVFYRVIRLSHLHFFTATGLFSWLKTIASPQALFWDTTFPRTPCNKILQRFRG